MKFNEDELDEFFVDKLNLIKRTMPRDPKIARQRRDEYMKKANNQQFDKPVFSFARLFSRKPKQTSFNQRRSLVPFAAAILLIFGLVFGSWGTVYAAQDSLPDDLLYPVRLVVEYLEDFNTVTVNPDGISRESARDGIQIHDRDLLQGRTGAPDKVMPMNMYGQDEEWKAPGNGDDPITPIGPGPGITITLPITPTQNGALWGPGLCNERFEELGECGPLGPLGQTYTYTHGLDTEVPPQFKGELENPVPDPNPPADAGFGPGSEQVEHPEQPPEPDPEEKQQSDETPTQVKEGGDKKKDKP